MGRSITQSGTAAALIVLAMAILGLIDNFVVYVADEIGLWQFHFVRSAIALAIIITLSRFGIGSLVVKSPSAVALRSFFVSTAMVLYFGSLAFLPVANAAAGLFTAPLFVLLISVFAFKRPVGPIRLIAAASGFLGVLLVLRPETEAVSVLTAIPILAGLFYGISGVTTRYLCAEETTTTLLAGFFIGLLFWGGVGISVLTVFPQDVPLGADGFILRGWANPSLSLSVWIPLHAVGAIVAVAMITKAYLIAEAGVVSIFEYAFLIWASLWAFVLRGELLDGLAGLGVGLIIATGAVIAIRGEAPIQARTPGSAQ